MEAAGLALSAAQTLLSTIQTLVDVMGSSELKQIFSKGDYLSELERLEGTVSAVKAVLLDAHSKDEEQLSHYARDSICKLKDAVYDADDLLDEFATLVKQQHLLAMEGKDKFLPKVRSLFSRFKEHRAAQSMSKEVKKIRKKLDLIADDASKYGILKDDRIQPIRRREETYAYVNQDTIVGREVDKWKIIGVLLHPNILGDVPVLAIVGMGGLGKTALAQLIYNDEWIRAEFRDRRFWVCVSDQDQNQFDIKAILARVYKSFSGATSDLDFDPLVQELRVLLNQDKYLLILDDVWTEDRIICEKLMDILIGSGQGANRGSRILVTTRSKDTAKVMGCGSPYELQGLSDENSWLLFKITSGIEQENHSNLVNMGMCIVKKCCNVPLAIKVIGSFLYGKNENTWKLIQQRGLSATRKDEDGIMPILKFSYHQLSPSLKSCFTYCSLFPKDFTFEKEKIISLWIAHGYVEAEDETHDIEVVAEYYFNILVQRCFFQDIEVFYGNSTTLITFKIHDLMHDMAQQVAGMDIFVANSATLNLDKKILHLYDCTLDHNHTKTLMTPAKIRSYFKGLRVSDNIQYPLSALLANWRRLRVLNLSELGISELPNAIGDLMHLRWLNLSHNQVKRIPNSFTKLINLQFLDLVGCLQLEELPRDFTRLVNLTSMNICDIFDFEGGIPFGLTYMPLGMEKMTRVMKLNAFIVGARKFRMEQRVEDLRVPRNLRGSLRVHIRQVYKHSKEYGGGNGILCNAAHLKSISMQWPYQEQRLANDDVVLEDLRPHGNLTELNITFYGGERIPRWLGESLPNLVKIVLVSCKGLIKLPWLGELQHLRTLQLRYLLNLEQMEAKTSSRVGAENAIASSSSSGVEISFPSLEELELKGLPKLKEWWGDGEVVVSSSSSSVQTVGRQQKPLFSCLSKVSIRHCANLWSIPQCPHVKHLEFGNSHDYVIIEEEDSRCGNGFRNSRIHDPKTKILKTNKVGYLKFLPIVAIQCVTRMEIIRDFEMASLSDAAEEFHGRLSSLRSLTICECHQLKSVSGGLKYLTALESLKLDFLPELSFDETQGEDVTTDGIPWRCVAHCLRSLELTRLDKVVELPKGMRHLTALQSLHIGWIKELKDLPEWIGCLSSLQSLDIQHCRLESLPEVMRKLTSLTHLSISSYNPTLKMRCESPYGVDWPKIQHVPHASCNAVCPNSDRYL